MSAVAVNRRSRVDRDSDTRARVGATAVRVITAIALVASVAAVALYLFIAARRIGHPYELEWIEGGSLEHVRRVLHGQQLYTRPTLEWTPNIYPPVYYWVAAAVARVVGLGFPALRAVSIVASLGLGAAVWMLVREETDELVGPTIATGLTFAVYRIGGAWFDVARVDSLFLALLIAGVLLARIARAPRTAAFAAAALILAIMTKQAALLPALAVVPWMLTRGRRIATSFLVTFVALGAAALAVMQGTSHGWFTYYVWTVPSGHEIERGAVIGFWTHDIGRFVAPMTVLAAGALVVLRRERASRVIVLHGPVFAALIAAAYTARLHTGGWDNVLLPAYVGLAVLAGIAVGRIRHDLAVRGEAVLAALLLVVAQFALLIYSPAQQLPAAGDTAAGHGLVAELRAMPQPVLLTGQAWMLDRAGLAPASRAHASALQDVLRAHAGQPARELDADIEAALRDHRYCSVVVDRPAVFASLPADLGRYYRPVRTLLRPGQLEPATGTVIVPWELWEPIGGPACGSR